MQKASCHRLQLERKRAGHTQETMAEIMNITTKYLSKVENGASTPSLPFILKFSEVTASDLNYLLRGAYPKDGGTEWVIRENGPFYDDPAIPTSKKGRRIYEEMTQTLVKVLKENNI